MKALRVVLTSTAAVFITAFATTDSGVSGKSVRHVLSEGVALREGVGAIAGAPDGSLLLASVDRLALRRVSPRGAVLASIRNPAGTVPSSMAAGDDQFYLVDGSALQIVDAKSGRVVRRVRVPVDASVAALTGGDVVVAGAANGRRFHVYDRAGQPLRAFGAVNALAAWDQQNAFMNSGVVAARGDRIVFVLRMTLETVAEVWSSAGELMNRFRVNSTTLDRHRPAAANVLANVTDGAGGYILIMAAAVDDSGHIWVAFNASAPETAVQEYSPAGELLREFALERAGGTRRLGTIKGMVVNGDLMTVVAGHTVVQWRVPSTR